MLMSLAPRILSRNVTVLEKLVEEAMTLNSPGFALAVELIVAIPLASVTRDVFDSVPDAPPVPVVLVKFTVIPDTGLPTASVTTTTSGSSKSALAAAD
jgi:hypothetical protein